MLIIRKIIRRKNSLNRKLQLSFEVFNLRNLMIIKDFAASHTYNTLYFQYTKESFQQLKTLFPELKIIACKEKNKILLATIAKTKIINPLNRIQTQKNENKNEKPP